MKGQVWRAFGPLAIAAAAFAMTGAPARAQLFGGFPFHPFQQVAPYRAPLQAPPPSVIRSRLERQGYQVNGPLRLNGDVVLADVTGPGDRRMRLVVDPIDGRILQRFAVAEPRPPRQVASSTPDVDDPLLIHGPSAGYLQDGSPAPAAPMPKIIKPAGKAKPKPGAVARANSGTPVIIQAPQPDALPEPAQPVAAPTAPVAAARPAPSPTVATPATPAPANATVARQSPPETAPAKPPGNPRDYANGVPINPLD